MTDNPTERETLEADATYDIRAEMKRARDKQRRADDEYFETGFVEVDDCLNCHPENEDTEE